MGHVNINIILRHIAALFGVKGTAHHSACMNVFDITTKCKYSDYRHKILPILTNQTQFFHVLLTVHPATTLGK